MNKLKKLGLISLCTFSILSVGVGAFTHSQNYERVKVSASDTDTNYYCKDMVYVRDLNAYDTLDFVNRNLVSNYGNDTYPLRYLYLRNESGSILEYQFGDNYTPFKIDYLEYDEGNDAYNLWVHCIDGDEDFYYFYPNDNLVNIQIAYNDNVEYDTLFNFSTTSEMYRLKDFNSLLYECSPIYDTDKDEEYELEIKYTYEGQNHKQIYISNRYVYIGGYSSSNYEYAPNGRYYVKFSNFDLETDDFNDLYDILPMEIDIKWILQNEYDILMSFDNHTQVYLSAWTLSPITWGNGVLNEGDVKNEQILTFNHHYYVEGVYYDQIQLTVVKTNLGLFFKNVTLRNVTSFLEKTLLAYGFNGETYTIDARYTGAITLVDGYKGYYQEMLSVFGLYSISSSSLIGGTTGNNDFFDTFGSAFNGVANILNIELLPNLSLWILLLIPFFVTLLLFVIKLFKR